jgi:Na+-translocating ferredoxin:NAD+ oxidoreductase RNF subunit RnfB
LEKKKQWKGLSLSYYQRETIKGELIFFKINKMRGDHYSVQKCSNIAAMMKEYI